MTSIAGKESRYAAVRAVCWGTWTSRTLRSAKMAMRVSSVVRDEPEMRIRQQKFGGNKYLKESMKVQSYRCDYCSKLKGESNRWWLGQPDGEHFTLALWDPTRGKERL